MQNGASALLPPPAWAVNGILVVVMGMLLPALLIPIIATLGHSEIVEEAAKALVVFFVILPVNGGKRRLCLGAALGALFGISESMLYLDQIVRSGAHETFWHRLALTVPMHTLTTIVLVLSGYRKKYGIAIGVIVAMALHMLFNARMGT